jgi:DNA polymerase-3 subunit delta'
MNSFKDVVGHEDILQYIRKVVKEDMVSHAYILNGEKGSGKKMLTRLFSSTLLCAGKENKPCNMCHACIQAENGTHPDLIWVTHEKEKVISVDDIRKQVSDTVQVRPYQSDYKIYVIDNAELMTIQAQNALLKTLEEPPSYVVFFLLTDNVEGFLSTITSRCVMLRLHQIREELVEQYLQNNLGVDKDESRVFAAFSGGNIGKAIALKENEYFQNIRESAVDLLKNVRAMSIEELIHKVKEVATYKLDINEYLDILLVWYRDVLLYKATYDVRKVIFVDEMSSIKEQAKRSSYEGIQGVMEKIENTKKRLTANVNFDIAMELLFLSMKEI